MRATAVVTVILIFALLCLSGCGGGTEALLRLLGLVLDDGSLQPIQGARVVASNGAEATTDAGGNFDAAGFPASGTVTITATGYQNTTVQINTQNNELDLGDVYLVPAAVAGTGTVSGTVTTAGGAIAPGASIRAADREATSRADGSYTLYNVPAGFQTLFAASADRSTSGTVNVTVLSSFETIANIRLSIQPPLPPS
ncbi:MAG: carboxypeptidase regulatory-like domain-containing protein [Armatimonadetes bacterium]|nr:carboxypeptidase regulatory-like domain-containing protein [Armatimonadota bacterium]